MHFRGGADFGAYSQIVAAAIDPPICRPLGHRWGDQNIGDIKRAATLEPVEIKSAPGQARHGQQQIAVFDQEPSNHVSRNYRLRECPCPIV